MIRAPFLAAHNTIYTYVCDTHLFYPAEFYFYTYK